MIDKPPDSNQEDDQQERIFSSREKAPTNKQAEDRSDPNADGHGTSWYGKCGRYLVALLLSSTFWTAGATIAIAAFTYELAYISGRQWQTMNQQLDLEQRPWLSADVKILGPLTFDATGNGNMLVSIAIENTGHSPASYAFDETRFVPMGVKRDQTDKGKGFSTPKEADRICNTLKQRAENPTNKANAVGYTLFPNRVAVRIQPLQLHSADIKEALAYSRPFQGNANYIMPIIVGCIDYGFVFEQGRHQTQFSWTVDRIKPNQLLARYSIEATGSVPLNELALTFSPPNIAN